MLGLEGAHERYCLDEAVGLFGSYVEGELDKIDGKNQRSVQKRREDKLRQLLGLTKAPVATKTSGKGASPFADPAAFMAARSNK